MKVITTFLSIFGDEKRDPKTICIFLKNGMYEIVICKYGWNVQVKKSSPKQKKTKTKWMISQPKKYS